jgi:hypothetical protein
MNKVISTFIAAVAALALTGGAYAQNDTQATTTTVPAAINTASGYGTTGVTNADSGIGASSPNASAQKTINDSPTPVAVAFGVNNTLATPSVKSPVASR